MIPFCYPKLSGHWQEPPDTKGAKNSPLHLSGILKQVYGYFVWGNTQSHLKSYPKHSKPISKASENLPQKHLKSISLASGLLHQRTLNFKSLSSGNLPQKHSNSTHLTIKTYLSYLACRRKYLTLFKSVANISGDAIADSLHEMLSESSRHDGEVATDPELANLAATMAKMINGNLSANKKICDPAAGSGSLISSAMKVFNINGNQVVANDINPKLIELLSLRLGLNNPITINKSNAPVVTTKDILSFVPSDFNDVEVVLLNPPFVAGINCVNRKAPFISFIQRTKGSPSDT